MPDRTPSNPRRVALLTSPSLFGAMIINRLAETPGIELAAIGLTNRVYRDKGPLATLRTLVRRTGWRYTWYSILVSNVAWTHLRLTGRPAGFKQAGQHVRYLPDVNSSETVGWLEERQPDYVASFYFNQWIGPGVRGVAKRRCINLHPSLLPEFRGPDPIFRMLQRGRSSGGFTIHSVEDEFDAGEILYQRPHDLPGGLSHLAMYLHHVDKGAQILGEWLAGRQESGPIVDAVEKDEYQGFPTPGEVRAFRRAGGRLGSLWELNRAIARVK